MLSDDLSPNENKVPFCSFCAPQSGQNKLMLKSAIRSIKKLTKTCKFKIAEFQDFKQKSQSSLGLQRLLKIMFQRSQLQLKLSESCNHSLLKNRLLNQFHCRSQDLQLLLEQLCDKIARRNYQLELMTIQVKNSQKSALKMQYIQELNPEKIQSSLNTEQLKEVQCSQANEVKVQQEPKQLHFFSSPTGAYISPQSGTNSEMNYMNPSFQYNMLYFGQCFYQGERS